MIHLNRSFVLEGIEASNVLQERRGRSFFRVKAGQNQVKPGGERSRKAKL